VEQTTPINQTFKATIEDRDGWACVVWSESVTFFGSTKAVKVKCAMNGVCLPDGLSAVGRRHIILTRKQKATQGHAGATGRCY
jgi:hypothetical protein